jgi:tetratricopeptide (TPR) repeat protein
MPRDWDLVLGEIESELGVELYMLIRQVRLFADSRSERPGRLFVPKQVPHVAERQDAALRAAPPLLRSPLRVLMRVSGRRPPQVDEIAHACEALASWAQDVGFPDTAVHLVEAAAVVHAWNPYFAFIAGRTNRLAGHFWRAELFYTRAVRQAYRKQKWDVYVRANLGLGRLHADRGRLRTAAKHLFSAARAAVDQGHHWLAAQIYHDLITLYYEIGQIGKACEVALRALTAYPKDHERYPVAVHDFLLLLIVERHYSEAWPMLERLVRAPLGSHEQVLVWGTVARTAGNLQLRQEYAEAEARVLETVPHSDAFAPAAYLGLAAGAHALGDGNLAESYSRKALLLAQEKQDHQTRRLAVELMDDISAGRCALPPVPLRGELADRIADLFTVSQGEELIPRASDHVLWKLKSWRPGQSWIAQSTTARRNLELV